MILAKHNVTLNGNVHAVVRHALLLACMVILCVSIAAYSVIDIFQPDSVPYVGRRFDWIVSEGRWLGWVLFPVLRALNGSVVIFLNLGFLFLFAFMAVRRYVEDSTYAAAFAALWILAPAWSLQLLWPFAILPATAFLTVAAFTVRKVPIYVFYVLFGVLLCGTLQHLYFVLPLLHLPLLTKPSFRENACVLVTSIFPAWVAGFLFGSIVSLLVVFGATWIQYGDGQIFLELHDWRKANPVDSLQDLFANTSNILGYWMIRHLRQLLMHGWPFSWSFAVVCGLSLALSFSHGKRNLAAKPLVLAVIFSVYVFYILFFGNFILFRTAGPVAAMGLVALLFLPSCASPKLRTLQIGLMVCLSVAWSAQTVRTLHWNALPKNAIRDTLIRVAPKPPDLYDAVAVMNSSDSIYVTTTALRSRLGLTAQGIDDTETLIPDSYWLSPSAFAAGFSRVLGCGSRDSANPQCIEINEQFSNALKAHETGSPRTLITVLGEHKGVLVVIVNILDTASRQPPGYRHSDRRRAPADRIPSD